MNASDPSPQIPGEPYRLMSTFVFLSVIGAGILLGLNWKKLLKPEWQWKTILISIFLPVLLIAFAIGWIILLRPYLELAAQFILSIPMLAFGANVGYLYGLARLQNGAYKKFKDEGFEALLRYEYNTDDALFFGGIVMLACAAFGIFVIPYL